MKRIISILFVLVAFVSNSFLSAASPQANERLQACLNQIYKLPEAVACIKEIEKEGSIRFMVDETHEAAKFGAFWDLRNRKICINPSKHKQNGEMIGSILFEMQNAIATSQFDELFDKAEEGSIDRDSYIRAIEYIEYQNSKRAASIAEAGIKKGLFPQAARLFTYSNFEEHFYYQHVGGHSQQIGTMYDRIAPKR